MTSRLDLVALSLLWTEGANRKPLPRRTGAQADGSGAASSDLTTLVDLEEVLARLGVEDVPARADRLRQRARLILAEAQRAGIELVARGDATYPGRLEQIPDPPPVLWTRGLVGPCDVAVAIVGSRTATRHGLEVGFRLGLDLARAGFVVVSGLARGIDAAAHRGALSGEGQTIAVLGSGVDVVYPPEHAALAAEIVAAGAMVSELAPGSPPHGWHFPRRNRIISGISLGVIIVEASQRSGSLITARCAAEQGRSVMAVPGAVLSGRNRGAHELLKDGAGVVEGALDVIAQLEADWRQVFQADQPKQASSEAPPAEPSRTDADPGDRPANRPGEALTKEPILRAMRPGEVYSLEDLAEQTGAGVVELMTRLARLEVSGWIQRAEGGRFVKAGANVLR